MPKVKVIFLIIALLSVSLCLISGEDMQDRVAKDLGKMIEDLSRRTLTIKDLNDQLDQTLRNHMPAEQTEYTVKDFTLR